VTGAEERFKELFKAARVLLREGIDQEDQLIPTLALANEICRDGSYLGIKHCFEKLAQDSEAWEREADAFVSTYGRLRPVRVVDGILILERLPLSIKIKYKRKTEQPEEVMFFVYAHRQLAKPQHVASLYEKTLLAADVPYGEFRAGRMGFEFCGNHLLITVGRGTIGRSVSPSEHSGAIFQIDVTPFPSTRIVQEFYEMLLGKSSGDGFRKDLATRTRGGAASADNLILACVAFYLKNTGKIKSRKEIHRLLNEHVLCESHKTLPEEGYTSSETAQLWRDVNHPTKVRKPLTDVESTLFFEGDLF
jgi:hypothetical protein